MTFVGNEIHVLNDEDPTNDIPQQYSPNIQQSPTIIQQQYKVERNLKCEHCNYTTYLKQSLDKHLKRKHPL